MIERRPDLTSYLGKKVRAIIDRPLGSAHPENSSIIYPINYGYLPNTVGGDGEEIDTYILGIDKPIKSFTGIVVAIVTRHNDVEDKLVVAPEGTAWLIDQIWNAIWFREQHYESDLVAI